MNRRLSFVLFAAVLLLPVLAWAQTSGGVFRGEVTDQTGAVLPNAEVRVQAVATGVVTSYKTTSEGIYTTVSLPAGQYLLTAETQGFKKAVFGPVILEINQTVRVDFALSVGSTSDSVTVQAGSAQLVQTETSEVSQVIHAKQVAELPLNGRNWQQLIALSAGVTPGSPGETGSSNPMNINGQRSKGNLFMVDGVSTTGGEAHTNGVVVPVDGIQEFAVQQNSFSAQYGNVAGGVITLQVKSGTNNWHGSAFEYVRNDALDATNYFTVLTGQDKEKYRFNQFGGSLGGPIKKNRTFIFADYQGTRVRQGVTFIGTVPTAAQRAGDFTQLRDANGNLIPIYDPLSGFPARTQFSDNGVLNKIPASRINPVSAAILAAMPMPNLFDGSGNPLPFNNYAVVRTNEGNNDSFDVRFDHTFTQRHLLFVRHSFGDSRGVNPSIFGPPLGGPQLFAGNVNVRAQNTGIGYTFIISPTLLNELRFGANRWRLNIVQEGSGENLAEQFGMPGINVSPETTGMSKMDVSGLFGIGSTLAGPTRGGDTTLTVTENLTAIKGRHTLRFGFEYANDQTNFYNLLIPRGYFVFEPLMTGSLLDLIATGNPHGNALASFLTGFPTAVLRDSFTGTAGLRTPRYGMYFQDDLKASSRLTLNLGVRYDILPPYSEAHGRMANFNPATATMTIAGSGLRDTEYHDVAPRVGFAYALTEDKATVVRGGFGIAYLNLINSPSGLHTLAYNPPFYYRSSLNQFPLGIPSYSLGQQLPATTPPPADNPSGEIKYVPPDAANMYSQTWNLSVERALTNTTTAQLTYAGSSGVHLMWPIDINAAGPGTTDVTTRRPYPQLAAITTLTSEGHSTYHSLQARIERRFSRGLYYLGTYTWSKTIDNNSTGNDGTLASGASPQDINNLAAEKGLSAFDRRHRFVSSVVWELPVGKGRRYGSEMPRALNWFVGGWQVSSIIALQSGSPVSVQMSCGDVNADGDNCRPDQIGNPGVSDPSRLQWFNTAAFALPSSPAFGNTRRNSIIAPGSANVDFGISKRFPVTEQVKFQFRLDVFNLFNHTNFGLPDHSIDSPGFGTITSAGAPRLLQLALRLEF